MRIGVIAEKGRVLQWHVLLAEHLNRTLANTEAKIVIGDADGELPSSVRLLLEMERLILRRSRQTLTDQIYDYSGEIFARAEFEADLLIDCTHSTPIASNKRVIRPYFAGAPGERAMINALLARATLITIHDEQGKIIASGFPSMEAADGLTGSIEATASRVMLLIQSVLGGGQPAQADPTNQTQNGTSSALKFGIKNLARECASRLYHLCCFAPHWRIGWRLIEGPGVLERADLSGPVFKIIADPGRRFFADPFPFTWAGRTFIAFEDLDHRVGRGTISAIELKENKPSERVYLLLAEPWHLSYPQFIEHRGTLYMTVESAGAGKTVLYRCTDFPLRWEICATLVDNAELADPTIFIHNGIWWMMSCVRYGIGGYSDALSIHYANNLLGPWRQHASHPVLVDCRVARPAGAVVSKQGELWRPVQDCSRGYGRALGLARIDKLDQDSFLQENVSNVSPGRRWPGGRLHTLNRCGSLECIDGTTYNPKWPALRRIVVPLMEPSGEQGDRAEPTRGRFDWHSSFYDVHSHPNDVPF